MTHAHWHIWAAARVIPNRQRPKGFEFARHRLHIGHDAGHVGRRRETTNDVLALVLFKRGLQTHQIRAAVLGFGNFDHFRAAFTPGQNVGVMFIGADNDHCFGARRQQMHQPIETRRGP